MFLYSTVSTLKPMVGIVVTTSPSFNLYNMVVLPAASNPTIKILISFLPNMRAQNFPNACPMLQLAVRSHLVPHNRTDFVGVCLNPFRHGLPSCGHAAMRAKSHAWNEPTSIS